MAKHFGVLALILFCVYHSEAQQMRKVLKKRTAEAGVCGSIGYYGNAHWGAGANIHYLHGVGRKKQWFSIGCGLRAHVFGSKKREYTTSSAKLTALNPGGADTLYMPEVQTNTLNAYAAIKIHVKRGVDVFFNWDIGGVNFGDSKIGYFRSYETNPASLTGGNKYKTEPYAFNLNMGGSDSYGTLVAEGYGSFRLNRQMNWRLGFNYLRNEYKIDRNVPMNGKRFYQNHWLVMSGISFDIRWKKNKAQENYWL
ncbi:MAG TPA: hypothetical protein PLP34_00385 [Chitinophagaceae bacterium]|nr:hypothetical protein [Chitinophagaceae bacterium]